MTRRADPDKVTAILWWYTCGYRLNDIAVEFHSTAYVSKLARKHGLAMRAPRSVRVLRK
jgi:hypothetical protein